MDYCGIDGYYGSWAPGAPGDWAARVRELHDLTGAPIVLNERSFDVRRNSKASVCGRPGAFGSSGGVMADAERLSGVSVCQSGKWPYTWGPGHTPEGQARVAASAETRRRPSADARVRITQAFEALAPVRHALLGQFYTRRASTSGEARTDPSGSAGPFVDLEGAPKPSYAAYRDAVRAFPH